MRTRAAAESLVALLLGAVVIAAAAAFGSKQTQEADARTSTWVDDRRGAHAIFLILENLGLGPARSFEVPHAATPTGRTLAVLAPSWAPSREEAAAILDWTARGGRLVVADGPSYPPAVSVDATLLLRAAGFETRPASGRASVATVVRADWNEELRTVRWPAHLVLHAATAGPDPRAAGPPEDLVTAPEGLLAARVAFGEGEVIAIADASLFANETLRGGDDALLAVRLLTDGGRPVLFDEYHHGFTGTGVRASFAGRLGGLVVGTWIGRALLVLAFALLVHAAGAAVRLGAPVEEPHPPRRALREHADALGRLLENARAAREAIEVLLSGVRRTVASRVGLPASATPHALRERLDRSVAPGARELARAMAEAEAAGVAPKVKDVEFARVAASLAAAKRRFLHG